MKILFVYFDFMKGAGGKYYEGIASISAVLKESKHQTDLFHIAELISCGKFLEIFEKKYADFDIVGFSSTTNAFGYSAGYSKAIKEHYNHIVTVCGGTHPTLCPEEAVQEKGFDIICIGEGEFPMLELCNNLEDKKDITNIQNLWIKKNGQIIKNAVRPFLEDLNSLPLPDRLIFDYQNSLDSKLKRIVIMGSRGCPFQCSYCCNHALKKLCPNSNYYVRFKSVERVLLEIKQSLKELTEIETVCFQDDILTLKPSWFKEFASGYAREIGIPYICNSRFDLLNEEVLESLRISGCIELRIGLESGNEFIRKEVLRRKQEQSQILKVGQLAHKKGIKLYIFTMIGLPFENLCRALDTVKVTAALIPATIQTSIYYPYAKTQLYEICREKGFLTGKTLDSYFEVDTVLNLPDFPKKQILFAYQNFKNFVKAYIFAARLFTPARLILEKTLDFIWCHPVIFGIVYPFYVICKKFFKLFYKNN